MGSRLPDRTDAAPADRCRPVPTDQRARSSSRRIFFGVTAQMAIPRHPPEDRALSAIAVACGTWPSPISAARVAAGSKPLSSLRIDFYAAPRLSPDGRQLAWLAWNHPSMPFFDTELWLADIDADGALVAPRRVACGIGESLAQPEWSPDGSLFVVSDRSGRWNLYRVSAPDALKALCPMNAEFSHPQWVFGRAMLRAPTG
jgi:hypothetical protein